MLRVVTLLSVLSLAAPAAAQDASQLPAPGVVDQLVAMGPAPAPAFGVATPFFAAQLVASANGRWFDRGWASLELALGVLGSGYSAWLVWDLPPGASAITSASYGAALAMNLRLVTHGVLSYALFSDGEDERARLYIPSISVSPVTGGAIGTATWAI